MTDAVETPTGLITVEDFAKVELRFGTVRAAEAIPKADKLLKLTVDFGEEQPRTIVAGIALTFKDPIVLVGEQFLFVTNLAPIKLRGVESHGMILATGDSTSLELARAGASLPPGSRLR